MSQSEHSEDFDNNSVSSNSENDKLDENINKSSQNRPAKKKRQITSFKVRKNRSWIWDYFKPLPPTEEFRTQGSCNIEIVNKKSPTEKRICSQIVRTQGSTNNFATHLGTHRITKTKPANLSTLIQSKIEDLFRHSTILDPYYNLPFDKQIKIRIHEGYNLPLARLKETLANEISRLLQLHDSIEVMYATILASSDKQTKKKARYLKSIMLTSDEWNIKAIDLNNLNTIFEEEKEDLVIDYDETCEIETTIKGHKVKISNPVNCDELVEKERKNAISFLRDILNRSQSNGNQDSNNIESPASVENHKFLEFMFGTTSTNSSNDDEIEKYLQMKDIHWKQKVELIFKEFGTFAALKNLSESALITF
ncbi:5535_t:CDS:2 [Gigaspora rosea]|nr:5535_t:CDS:2 [Gigaspora rosea]